jgi:hypothetical protein
MARQRTPATIPATGKHIQYDRETGDYAMFLDGEIVGYAASHHEAETTLDTLVYEILRRAMPQAA